MAVARGGSDRAAEHGLTLGEVLGEVLGAPMTAPELLSAVRERVARNQRAARRRPRETAALIRERLPDLAAQTVSKADRALAGMLVLPGTGAQPYFVGNPPDWFANPVDDNEYLWILHRTGHWRSLLALPALCHARHGQRV